MSLIGRMLDSPVVGATVRPVLHYMSRQRLPQLDGRRSIAGLSGPVDIYRDKWGIPHIYATSRSDLFKAQGYVHAQDRLWQMEVNRLSALGQLAALLGPAALGVDRLSLTLGFGRLANASWPTIDDQTKEDAQSYCSGVNALLAETDVLPIEFRLLRHQPEPWQPIHCLTFGRLIMWSLTHGWAGELTRARLIEKVGADLAAELDPVFPATETTVLPDGVEFQELTIDEMLRPAIGPFLGRGRLDGAGRGSNSWVISAARSTTGHALLCNDMHLPVGIPSLWYICQLESPQLAVAGATLPGLPYVLVGQNQHIAWGATLAFTDCEDLFIEQLHPQDPTLYRFQGEWHQVVGREAVIAVRGNNAWRETLLGTHHGPLISNLWSGEDKALALQSTALRDALPFDGFAKLNSARDWNDFVFAVSRIEAPSLNLLYADSEDNIGYFISGKVPIRRHHDGQVPVPGWSGKYDWIDFIPLDEMPHALNPAKGYIISANNRPIGSDYGHYLGNTWVNGARAGRIEQLLTEKSSVSPDECRRIQRDWLCQPGLDLVALLRREVVTSDEAKLAWWWLDRWDGRLEPTSVGGAFYQVVLYRLADNILKPHLQGFLLEFLGHGPDPLLYPINEFDGHWPVTVCRLLSAEDTAWIGTAIGRQALVERSLSEATTWLRSQLGSDPEQWQWGKLHWLNFNHVLSAQPPLNRVFDRGPFPIGGDANTIFQTAAEPGNSQGSIAVTVSYRQIIELTEPARSQAMHAPGQSGHLGSPHYDDLLPGWFDGEYVHPWRMRSEPETWARHHLILASEEAP